ncbi:transglutaminase-like domain-containing protein [Aridibaculum aurantiacum]|uniref:transglutaminase-like domain-containing protein n=1 Tax=Aridibaculum aurantiacum TaxID=2810307 RepID=UPI001A97BD0C|nr:transglutaminase-like domain-containing protein [Aridibaculum aurantiacum]
MPLKFLLTITSLFYLAPLFAGPADKDTNVVISSKKEAYLFEYNKKQQRVEVNEKTNTIYLCNQFRTTVPVVEFYNDQTAINDVKIIVNGERNKLIKPQFDYHSVSGIFYSDARVCYFRLPLEKIGTTSEVQFDKTVTDPRYFTSIYFPEEYKVANKEVTVTIPRWMKAELKEYNFAGNDITRSQRYDERADADIYTYTIKQLPARVSENDAPGPSYIYPHVLVLTRSAQVEGKSFTYFNTTKDQYNWYRSLVKELTTDEAAMKAKAADITQGKTAELDKVKSIFYWVQDNIRYIAFEDGIAGFKPENAQEVLRKKYGDCKGMANLTKELLKAAGFDARLCWIGTNHIAYDYSTPSLAVDNHMICALNYKGKQYFLDATEKYIPIDQYAERIQGRQVLIEDDDNYILEKVPATRYQQNTMYEKRVLALSNNSLEGKAYHKYNGESKEYLLYHVNNLKKDKASNILEQYLAGMDAKYQLTKLETSDMSDWDKDLTINYNVVQKDAITSFGDELYVDVDFRKEFADLLIDTSDRRHDYVFDFKRHLLHETEIDIPASYKLQQLPAALSIDRKMYTFKTNFIKEGNKLVYKKEIIVKDVTLPKNMFTQWNNDIKELKKAYLEQVILVKQ